jgi:large subunit ribosomal protein L23
MKADPYGIIRRPLVTEKGMTGVEERNQYPFEVATAASKGEIKRAIEEAFSVRVANVATMTRKGKPRRSGRGWSKTSDWKRAIVTLAPGESIEFI